MKHDNVKVRLPGEEPGPEVQTLWSIRAWVTPMLGNPSNSEGWELAVETILDEIDKQLKAWGENVPKKPLPSEPENMPEEEKPGLTVDQWKILETVPPKGRVWMDIIDEQIALGLVDKGLLALIRGRTYLTDKGRRLKQEPQCQICGGNHPTVLDYPVTDSQPPSEREKCPTCGGSGQIQIFSPPADYKWQRGDGDCPTCQGTGKAKQEPVMVDDCVFCNGTGKRQAQDAPGVTREYDCWDCDGTGKTKPEPVMVDAESLTKRLEQWRDSFYLSNDMAVGYRNALHQVINEIRGLIEEAKG